VPATALIALDWGTTHARAWRLGAAGAVLESREAPLGVQHVADGDFGGALRKLLGDWRTLAVPRIAGGMIGSRQGWVEAPYLPCPAKFADLATSLVVTPGDDLRIVPGITTRDGQGVPDVMRGEETQLAGIDDGADFAIAVLPGTHSKWARVERGAIADFRTYMTGELYAALLDHTILGRLAERRDAALREHAFEDGVTRGLAEGQLLHDAFGARTRALAGELPAADVADWLSGLLIGREIRDARGWIGTPAIEPVVGIVGNDALVDRYRRALLHAGVRCAPAPADAAVRGLWRIAREAGLVP